MGRAKILLAEDEPAIREGLALLFQSEGYDVQAVADGREAVAAVRAQCPDLLVLDVMMPRLSGYGVCLEIRQWNKTLPILFLTAKDSEADELRGLGMGADDYLSKTVSERILLSRVEAALRRGAYSCACVKGARGESGALFHVGTWQIDGANACMANDRGRRVLLSLREVELLRHFVQHAGELLSRDALLTRFWGASFPGNEEALTVAISRLREKLGAEASLIQTRARQGYVYGPRMGVGS